MSLPRFFPLAALARGALLAPELSGIVEWCETFRRLADSSNQLYSAEAYPHQRMPLVLLSQAGVEEVGLVWASQHGKTTTLENALFAWTCRAPGTAIWAVPDEKLKGRHSRRIANSINATPRWRAELARGKRAASREIIKFKKMDLHFAIGGSEADMSSTPARYVVIDEIDKFPVTTKREGSPRAQLKKRQRTFHDRKMLLSSTPTTEEGEIWRFAMAAQLWEACAKCPGCDEWHPWAWRQVRWEERPHNVSFRDWGERVRDGVVEVWYECPRCAYRFSEAAMRRAERGMEYRVCNVGMSESVSWDERLDLIHPREGRALGEGETEARWVIPAKTHWRVCFHKSAIATQDTPLRQLVQEWLDALQLRQEGEDSGVQDFFIHHLARPFSRSSLRHAEREVTDRVVDLEPGVVPERTKYLSCGVDVQRDGFFAVWLAFIPGGRVHVCKHLRIKGGFEELATALQEPLRLEGHPGGVFAQVHLIDAGEGMRTASVRAFCDDTRWSRGIMRPCKGANWALRGGRIYTRVKDPEADMGEMGIMVGTITAKDWFGGLLSMPLGGDMGSVSFHSGVLTDSDFQRQMVSEQRIDDRGRVKWVRRRGYVANHYWDATIYAVAGGHHMGAGHISAKTEEGKAARMKVKTEDFVLDR